jgi:hypothetical protein
MPHLPLLKPLDGVLSRGGSDYVFHAIRQKFDTILSCSQRPTPPRQAAGRQEEGEAGVVCVLTEHGQAEREEVNRDIPGAVWLNRALETCWNASLSTLSTKVVTAKGELR